MATPKPFNLIGSRLQSFRSVGQKPMAKTTFSMLPAEIHASIAEHCEKWDLVNLCKTSKWLNERCSRVLYRHVDLRFSRNRIHKKPSRHLLLYRSENIEGYYKCYDINKQRQFIRTLLTNLEYGKHVRSLKGSLAIPSLNNTPHIGRDKISDEQFWCTMLSLTHVQSLEIGSINSFANRIMAPTKQFPSSLFQSTTSVRLAGHMQYGLAKTILTAINPTTLEHLCLDMVQDHKIGHFHRDYVPGDRGEDGQMIAVGATSGLLRTMTGRCTALRTLILRRIGQIQRDDVRGWHTAAEEASYTEWTSFIRSVQGTVENFKFDQAAVSQLEPESRRGLGLVRIMDERFQRLMLPAIVSGNWPCLTNIELRGVRYPIRLGGIYALKKELRVVLGRNVEILVEEDARIQTLYDSI